jgi:selenocysteine lyase/cysteine desulfurase
LSFDVEALREREFPWSARGEAIYLNNASTGPLPERTLAALREFDERRAAPYRLSDDLQFATLARGRDLIARLIGADTEEIGLAVNTSYGINVAAFGLPLGPGDVVLTPDREFPANVYPWMQLARKRGVIYRRLPTCDGAVDEDALRRELEDPAVRAVSISWVGFASGYTVDLEASTRFKDSVHLPSTCVRATSISSRAGRKNGSSHRGAPASSMSAVSSSPRSSRTPSAGWR